MLKPRSQSRRASAWAALAMLFAGRIGHAEETQPESQAWKLPRPTVDEAASPEGRYLEVRGARIHYVEQGKGDPIVFIHGTPTSSYLWRNVLPHVAGRGRAIALDLVGMGRSDKPRISYHYQDHFAHLDAFLEALELSRITFVVHDWGATLGFDYATRHPERVARIAFMEGVLPPLFPQPSFEEMGEEMGGLFRALKDPQKGRAMVIDQHMFVEQILPNFVNRPLGAQAMTEYRRPYVDPGSREPLLAWPRQIPIGGEPADVIARMGSIARFMATTEIPILLLYAEPGVLVPRRSCPGTSRTSGGSRPLSSAKASTSSRRTTPSPSVARSPTGCGEARNPPLPGSPHLRGIPARGLRIPRGT